ncbi:hypothetical protein XVE_1521 [Xanthomonas vesicatoria ATCC 35937]|uniref:Uncharacterized protein n=1 Tax=Xanthomonas vesicatoria ATCC 35937 TaxID=925775 RepID=F0BBP8_9XANT|nr:hypothetical protein XVE_1521 [Xanthomonas vesicatoria ATCC 35937]
MFPTALYSVGHAGGVQGRSALTASAASAHEAPQPAISLPR